MLRSAPPPPWVDLNQELVEEMERINRKTEDLKKLHRQHLLPGFDEDDRHSEEHQIDQLGREIAQSLQSCDLGVKQIAAPGGARNLSPQEARVRASAQTSLATRLHGLTTRYRKEQDSYMSKLEKQGGGGDAAAGGGRDLNPFEDDDGARPAPSLHFFSVQELTQKQTHDSDTGGLPRRRLERGRQRRGRAPELAADL